jgi:hypothetical protein
MKAMALVPAAIAAILALNISSASSQAACGKEYQACMSSCATRSTKAIQDGCFQGCESKNNFCFEKVYGKRPAGGAPAAAAAEQKGPAQEAMAKKGEEAAQALDSAKEQPAQERPPQRGPKAPQQSQKAPQRGPARH